MIQLGDVMIGGDEGPKVVGVIYESGQAQQAVDEGADIIEFRVDLADDTSGVLRDLEEVALPVILTNRRVEEGGNAAMNRREQLTPLISYASIVDIELMAPDRDDLMAEAATHGRPTLISYHDLDGTPSEAAMLELMRTANGYGDLVKLAVTIEHLHDAPRVLDVSLAARDEGLTFSVVPMGALGSHIRPLMGIYGSSLLYGYVGEHISPKMRPYGFTGKRASPGMLSVSRLERALEEIRSWQ
ncbi:MAG TPA: type I 3-dehydroquinate dehydratase [Candidatus Bathyarchaeia archaeon]|nr:type I 3-dehydroquinate dehydratase [Candidatus Bathyarchaeia archaeon]